MVYPHLCLFLNASNRWPRNSKHGCLRASLVDILHHCQSLCKNSVPKSEPACHQNILVLCAGWSDGQAVFIFSSSFSLITSVNQKLVTQTTSFYILLSICRTYYYTNIRFMQPRWYTSLPVTQLMTGTHSSIHFPRVTSLQVTQDSFYYKTIMGSEYLLQP